MKTKLLFSLLIASIISFQAIAQPANNNFNGAIPITPSLEGTGCNTATFTLPFTTDGTTDSGLQGGCNTSGLDQFFTWTATTLALDFSSQTPGNPGIVVWNSTGTIEYDCGDTFSITTLNGWEIGDDLVIQIYDFQGSFSDIAFCLELNNAPPPPPSPITFTTQNIAISGSSTAAVVDMNGDYLDDIVSASSSNVQVHFQQSAGGFTTVNIPTPTTTYTPSWSIAAGDFDKNGYTDLLYGNGSRVTFMKAVVEPNNLNNGNDYDDVTSFSEIALGQYVFSQRSNFIDINNDGHLDAFVCHDVEPNVYYINDGSGNFTFNQGGLGDYSSGGNYGSVWIDYDNDGDLDLFIAKCGGETARRLDQMHRNNGNGTFTEVSVSLNLSDPMQTWSSTWGDFDNDGDMDVFVGASSGVHKLMRNDVSTSGDFTNVTAASNVNDMTTLGHENLTFDFDNDGNLDIVSNGNILFGNGDMTFSLQDGILSFDNGSFGDLNNDGFIDAFDGGGANSRIYFNDGNANNWIKINTQGIVSNINGIGARIEIQTAAGTQIREVRSGEGFAFMSSLNTHIGLGSETSIIKVTVRWPSGLIDEITNPTINQDLTVLEGSHPLSVEDETLSDIIIFPNPVKSILTINTSGNLTNKIATVFDINGKRVINERLTSNILNVSNLQSGIYILRLESDGKLINRKFIKQ